jgi:hypothetical protein
MKKYFLLLFILTSFLSYSNRSFNEPWLQIGGGINYKGFVGVQGHLYGKADLMRIPKKNFRISIFNRAGFGFGAWGLAWQGYNSVMAQIRIRDNHRDKIGFNYAYGYSTNIIIAERITHKFSGFGTHQIGVSIPREGDIYISFQACKYFWQTLMTLEIGASGPIKFKKKYGH